MVAVTGWDAGRPTEAFGVSDDGRVIVGVAYSSALAQGIEAFREADGVIAGLGGPEGSIGSVAADASADGSVVVGRSMQSGVGWEAFIWTEATGMTLLGSLPGETESNALAVSSDGKTIVGETTMNTSDSKGFYWTAAEGIVSLQNIDQGIVSSYPADVSGDGSVIVGRSFSQIQGWTGAFIWTKKTGIRCLADVLAEQGVDVSGWKLDGASGVSDDGRTIVGSGVNPDGVQEAWIADLSSPLVDLVCPCDGAWKNHGQFVRCVANEAKIEFEEGLLTLEEKNQLVSDSADSDCGNP